MHLPPPALKFSVFIYTIRTFLILTHHFWRRLIEHDGFWELMWMTGHIILTFMIWIQSSIFMRKKYKKLFKTNQERTFQPKGFKNPAFKSCFFNKRNLKGTKLYPELFSSIKIILLASLSLKNQTDATA